MRFRLPYRLLMAAGAVTVIGAAALAQDGFLLKRVYKAGETEKFKTSLKISSGAEAGNAPARFEVTIHGTESVKEIKADGSTVVEMKPEKSVVNFAGQEREIPGGGQTITTVFDKEGRVVPDKKGAPAQGGPNPAQMLAFARAFTLPDKPLKAGEEHKFDHETKEDGKVISSVKGVMTVVGMEKKGGELAADSVKVKMAVDSLVPGPAGAPAQNIHIDGHCWIEPGSGRLVMMTGKVTGFKLPQLGDATVELKRVRVGEVEVKVGADKAGADK